MSRLSAYKLGDTYGGLYKDVAPHIIPNNAFTLSENWTLRKLGVETIKGWTKFTDQVLTDGAASPTNLKVLGTDEFFKRDGSSFLIAVTNRRLYSFDTAVDLWIPITNCDHNDTTVDQDSTSGTADLFVASTTGYAVNDRIIVHEGGAREEEAVIDSINAGVSLGLDRNLTFTHTAVQADPVRRIEHRARVDSDSTAGSTTLNVDTTDGFIVGEEIVVGATTARAEYLIIDSIMAGVSFTVSRPSWAPSGTGLQFTHTAAQADTVIRLADLIYADSTLFSSTILNDTWFFTNFTTSIQEWTGETDYTVDLDGTLTGDSVEGLGTLTADIKAKFIFGFEGFLVIGHLQENGETIPQKIRWCQFGDVHSWENELDGSGQAGAFVFDGADFINGMFQLKRELLSYRERSIEAMTYIGPPDIFGFRRAETGTGLLAGNALIDMGDRHVLIGPDNVWTYNGINLVPLGDAIKDNFFDELDPSQKSNIKMFFVEESDEIWMSFSSTGSFVHDKAYIYNIVLDKWSGPRDVDATGYGYYTEANDVTWDSAMGEWDNSTAEWDSRVFRANSPLNLMGNDDGLIFKTDFGTDKNGSTISARFESKLTDCDMPEVTKRLQRVKVGLQEQGTTVVSVYIGAAFNVGDTVDWYGPYELSQDSDVVPFIYVDITARYFKVRVDTEVTSNIRDIELFFIPRKFR